MKVKFFKKYRFQFFFLFSLFIQFSILKSYHNNKYNQFRLLTQTINDFYQNIISIELPNYSSSDISHESIFNDYIFQLTTTYNEEKVLDGTYSNTNGLSIINLDKCKSKLYSTNGIDTSIPLIILKLEKKTDNIYEKSVQYEIYNPETKRKITLEDCKSIDLYIQIPIDEDLEKLYESLNKEKYNLFDINDPFYNDICTSYKTINGTDILLSDRRKYYLIKEFAPQSNCKYSNYSSDVQSLKFECTTDKDGIDLENVNKFNGLKALSDLDKDLKNLHLKVFKCYKSIFNTKIITKNFGSIILIVIILINLLLSIVYIIQKISPLRLYVAKFIFLKPNNNNSKIGKENMTELNAAPKKRSKTTIMKRPKLNSSSENDDEEKKSENLEQAINNRNKKKKTTYKKKHFSKTNNYTRTTKKSKTTTKRKIETTKGEVLEDIEKSNNSVNNKNIYPPENYELNRLELDKALHLDKRNFCQIFYSIIKREQIILFTFFSWNDYNLAYIKFARFFFLLSTEIAMNVLLFFDSSIHELFLNKGKFNFVKFILQIIISSFVSHVIEVIVCFLTMTDKYIYQIKKMDNNEINKIMVMKTLNCINIKLSSFFVFIFIFMIIYWYLITTFCAVYENAQTILLINSLISFVLYLIYPILFYFIISLFKYIGLKTNSSCIYKLGNVFPLF